MRFLAPIRDDVHDRNIEKLVKAIINFDIVRKNNLKVGYSTVSVEGEKSIEHHIDVLMPLEEDFLNSLEDIQKSMLTDEKWVKDYNFNYAPVLRIDITSDIRLDNYRLASISWMYYGELMLRDKLCSKNDPYAFSMFGLNPNLYWNKSQFLTAIMEAAYKAIQQHLINIEMTKEEE